MERIEYRLRLRTLFKVQPLQSNRFSSIRERPTRCHTIEIKLNGDTFEFQYLWLAILETKRQQRNVESMDDFRECTSHARIYSGRLFVYKRFNERIFESVFRSFRTNVDKLSSTVAENKYENIRYKSTNFRPSRTLLVKRNDIIIAKSI